MWKTFTGYNNNGAIKKVKLSSYLFDNRNKYDGLWEKGEGKLSTITNFNIWAIVISYFILSIVNCVPLYKTSTFSWSIGLLCRSSLSTFIRQLSRSVMVAKLLQVKFYRKPAFILSISRVSITTKKGGVLVNYPMQSTIYMRKCICVPVVVIVCSAI